MLPVNDFISPSDINKMVSFALQAHNQKDSEFLGAAIAQLAQYPLTPEQNNKIVGILKNVTSESVARAPISITQALTHPLLNMPLDVMRSIFCSLSFQDV